VPAIPPEPFSADQSLIFRIALKPEELAITYYFEEESDNPKNQSSNFPITNGIILLAMP